VLISRKGTKGENEMSRRLFVAIAIMGLGVTSGVLGQGTVTKSKPAAKTPRTTIRISAAAKNRTENVDNNESVQSSSKRPGLLMIPDWKGITTNGPIGRTMTTKRAVRNSSRR
jgi:hypothetical protein